MVGSQKWPFCSYNLYIVPIVLEQRKMSLNVKCANFDAISIFIYFVLIKDHKKYILYNF